MITESIIVAAAADALKSAAADAVTSAAIARGREALALTDPRERIARALAEDQERMFWLLQQVAISVVRNLFGREVRGGDEAWALLVALAEDPGSARRFRALMREAAVASDDKVAMLATAYFVGGQPTSLRERLDWAVRAP